MNEVKPSWRIMLGFRQVPDKVSLPCQSHLQCMWHPGLEKEVAGELVQVPCLGIH